MKIPFVLTALMTILVGAGPTHAAAFYYASNYGVEALGAGCTAISATASEPRLSYYYRYLNLLGKVDVRVECQEGNSRDFTLTADFPNLRFNHDLDAWADGDKLVATADWENAGPVELKPGIVMGNNVWTRDGIVFSQFIFRGDM